MPIEHKNCFLVVETSASQGSLAVFNKATSQTEIFEQTWQKKSTHSETIILQLLDLLSKSQTRLEDLQSICIDAGPGSFTGLRVGLSFAKSLSYSLNIPIYVYDSLFILAEQTRRQFPSIKQNILCLVNAFSDCVYAAEYKVEKSELISESALTSLNIEKCAKAFKESSYLCAGDGFEYYRAVLSRDFQKKSLTYCSQNFPLAKTLGEIFLASRISPQPKSWNLVNPLYIRGSEAEEKLRSGSLKPVNEF